MGTLWNIKVRFLAALAKCHWKTVVEMYVYSSTRLVVQSLSRIRLFVTPGTVAHQTSLFFTISQSCASSCPLSWWCHPTIPSSMIPFSSFPQSFPASGSFPMSQLFTSGCQNIGASASASVFPMNTQDWFPLGLAGLISLSRNPWILSSTTFQRHQFFGTQPSLWSNTHICTWLLGKT